EFSKKHKTPDKIEEISLYNFLLFCQKTLAERSKTLNWEDKSSVHQEYYNGIKKKIDNHRIQTWGKLGKKDLENVLDMYKKVYTKGYYLILQFWADVAAIYYIGPKNYESLINKVQILISLYEDVNVLKCTVKYVANLSEQQIRTIILKAEKDISKFGAKILHQIFDKNQIKLLFPDKIFESSPSEYENIYFGITNALHKYEMNSECAPIIEINGFETKDKATYLNILENWFREWVNPSPVMSESYYVEIYIYRPLQIILHNLLYLRIHLYGPEHETKCSFERRSWHHYPPYGEWPSDLEESRSIFDVSDELNDQNIIVEEKVIIKNQIDDEPIIFPSNATILLNEDAKLEITYVRVYSKKVDTALTYIYRNNLAYLLIVEAKLPNAPFHGVYDKLLRSINDAINSFLIYIAKDAKNITSILENLLKKLRWIAIFVAEGRFSLMAIKLMDNYQLRLCFPIGEARVPVKSDNISDSIFLLSLLIYIRKTVNENLIILKEIEKEIERIKSESSSLEEINLARDFLEKTVHATPSTPLKYKKFKIDLSFRIN
ncbi:25512_t:CDS:2, partial [Dentiscutata erythropus]